MKKTAAKIYEQINREAIRLMLQEGLPRDKAFEKAVPLHFEQVAVEENKLPSLFTEMVWRALNKIQDQYKLDKVANGRILIELQLTGRGSRVKVYEAFVRLEKWGIVYRPNGKTWSRSPKVAGVLDLNKARDLAAASD